MEGDLKHTSTVAILDIDSPGIIGIHDGVKCDATVGARLGEVLNPGVRVGRVGGGKASVAVAGLDAEDVYKRQVCKSRVTIVIG